MVDVNSELPFLYDLGGGKEALVSLTSSCGGAGGGDTEDGWWLIF